MAVTSIWRPIGQFRQARTREELRGQSIEDWNPWEETFERLSEPDIAIPHPTMSLRLCHVQIYSAAKAPRFVALSENETWYFYVPASKGDVGAFEAVEVRYEGHWRGSRDESSELPWPMSDENWNGRALFLESLERIETHAEKIAYRGISMCRICDRRNGHEALRWAEWEWPAGYRHYVADHYVRPSADFEALVLAFKA